MSKSGISSSDNRYNEPEDGELVDERPFLPARPATTKWSNPLEASIEPPFRPGLASSSRLPRPTSSYRPHSVSPTKPTPTKTRDREWDHGRSRDIETYETRSSRYEDYETPPRRRYNEYRPRSRSPVPRHSDARDKSHPRREERYDHSRMQTWDSRRSDDHHRRDEVGRGHEDQRSQRRDRDERDRRYDNDGDDRRRNGHLRSPPRSPRSGGHHQHRSPRKECIQQVEDGEIESPVDELKQDTTLKDGKRPRSPDIAPASSSPQQPPTGRKPIKLKRPTRFHPQPETPDSSAVPDVPASPPLPPPPPPPDNTPPPRPPTPSLSVEDTDTSVQTPYGPSSSDTQSRNGLKVEASSLVPKLVNRTLEATKSRSRFDDQKADSRVEQTVPVPEAPNRNVLQPSTRPSTPVGIVETVQIDNLPKSYRRPTLEQEFSRLHKEFKGTTTLSAYDIGSKLGEGTFG